MSLFNVPPKTVADYHVLMNGNFLVLYPDKDTAITTYIVDQGGRQRFHACVFGSPKISSVLPFQTVRREVLLRNANEFFPSSISHYDVSTGAIECGAKTGLVDKYYSNRGHDRTTLLTFTYPKAADGRMCQFKFFLPESATLSGSEQIDVFTSLAPAPGCKKSWPPGNQRDRHLGRLSVERGEFGTWQSTYLSYLTTPTPCKAPNTVEGFELVGVNDQDHVSWGDVGSYGAQIVYF